MGFWDSLGSGKKKKQSIRTPDSNAQGGSGREGGPLTKAACVVLLKAPCLPAGVDSGRSGGAAAARPRALSLTGDTTRQRAEKQQPADFHLLRHPSLILPNSRPPHVGPRSLEDSWRALQSGGASGSAASPTAAKPGRGAPSPALPRVGSEPAGLREAGAEAASVSVASVGSSSTLSADGTSSRETRGSRSAIRDFFQGDLHDSRRQMKRASKAALQAKPKCAGEEGVVGRPPSWQGRLREINL